MKISKKIWRFLSYFQKKKKENKINMGNGAECAVQVNARRVHFERKGVDIWVLLALGS